MEQDKYANRDCMNVGKWTKLCHTIPYIWGCRQAKSHMMAYDKQLTNFTLMYDEKDYLVNGA